MSIPVLILQINGYQKTGIKTIYLQKHPETWQNKNTYDSIGQ